MDPVTVITGLLSGPVGMIGLVVLGVFAPKIYAVVAPLFSAVLSKLKPAPAPTPMPDPPTPVPPPGPPPVVPKTGHPVIDLAMQVLQAIASAKFPNLLPADALARHLVHEASNAAFIQDSVNEQKAATPAAAPAEVK